MIQIQETLLVFEHFCLSSTSPKILSYLFLMCGSACTRNTDCVWFCHKHCNIANVNTCWTFRLETLSFYLTKYDSACLLKLLIYVWEEHPGQTKCQFAAPLWPQLPMIFLAVCITVILPASWTQIKVLYHCISKKGCYFGPNTWPVIAVTDCDCTVQTVMPWTLATQRARWHIVTRHSLKTLRVASWLHAQVQYPGWMNLIFWILLLPFADSR